MFSLEVEDRNYESPQLSLCRYEVRVTEAAWGYLEAGRDVASIWLEEGSSTDIAPSCGSDARVHAADSDGRKLATSDLTIRPTK